MLERFTVCLVIDLIFNDVLLTVTLSFKTR